MKNRSWVARFLITVCVCVLLPGALVMSAWLSAVPAAAATEAPAIPDDLKPWKDWVLHGKDQQVYGVPEYNNAARRHCGWPTELTIDATDQGARFAQEWHVNCDVWVTLPGGDPVWPLGVRVDGAPVVTVKRGGTAAVKLGRGDHRITGRLTWKKLPENLQVPPNTGLIELSLNGETVPFPRLDASGRLWFQVQRQVEETIENRLTVQTFRLITDDIPPRMTVFLKLDVAGAAREAVLGTIYSRDRFVPLSLDSQLPARIESDGRLTLQLRPGQWTVSVTARHTGPLTALTFDRPDDGIWPEQSIWSFEAQSRLRIVEITGVPGIDPQQTSMPDGWRRFPAYRMLPGDTMTFEELKRGNPDPAPDQLSLERKAWLRFDGSGYTIQDRITGQKNNDWRLEMNPPITLGKVEVDGAIQFITRRENTEKQGVEIRRGTVQLTADSETGGDISRLPLTGWDQAFQGVRTHLVLPPGYRLIHAAGTDNVPDTWITRWNLLDLFFVLLFTAAVGKLYSRRAAILAFITLGLLIHESGAPVWIWLAVIIGVALLKYLPPGWFRYVVRGYQILVIIILAAMSVIFSVNHIRNGLYPQLERSGGPAMMDQFMLGAAAAPEIQMDGIEEAEQRVSEYSGDVYSKLAQSAPSVRRTRKTMVAQYDPRMQNQTGPGLPDWQWNSIYLQSGPTEPGRSLRLFMTGPVTNRILAFIRVGLLIALGFVIFGARYSRRTGWSAQPLRALVTGSMMFILVSGAIGAMPAPAARAEDFPSPQLLQELEKRLLEADDCFPYCADVAGMDIRIHQDGLRITMEIHSRIDTAVPLPGDLKHWLPGEVRLDGRPISALMRSNGVVWALIPAGVHRLEASGPLPSYATVQLPLPMKPGAVIVDADGWTVEGIRDTGSIDNQLQFTRLMDEEDGSIPAMTAGVLPPFVKINRTLLLGLDWRVETTVERVSPPDAAIVLDIPLLPGESVITEGLEVKDGTARINMDAARSQIQWESILEPRESIRLEHPEQTMWTETWEVDVSPILHMEYDGIPVIMRQQDQRWFPMWHPWPGESLMLTITRPEGVPGQTLTIQRSSLDVRPGKRVTDCELTMTAQSSQGMQHAIRLPDDVQVQELTINGQPQPIRREGRNIPVTITPGMQTIGLKWREARGVSTIYRTPEVDLGIRSVNSTITMNFPTNRWLLWVRGPQMGPAVLFWTFLIVIILAALILSRTGWTPLKFRHWLLLGLGMSQGGLPVILIVVIWLVAMHFREKMTRDMNPVIYDALQIAYVFFTVIALVALIVAISSGLLGQPDMSIAGNGSSRSYLKWYQDSTGELLPSAAVVSIPLFFYRIAMLLWALWLAFYMITILKWCWKRFSEPVFWHTGK